MSLKDEVRWVEPNFVITKEGKQRYQPIRQRDMVAFIPVEALRAWLRNEIESITDTEDSLQDCGHRGAYSSLLAELEGLS